MLTLQQWKAENKEWYEPGSPYNEVTPVPASKFIQRIGSPDLVFVDEGDTFTGEGSTRYVMYNSLSDVKRGKNRVTNIDVYPSDKEIRYEGRGSVWHEIVGTDSDYATIVSILKEKVVDPSTIDYVEDDFDPYARQKFKPDYELAKKLQKRYGGELNFSWEAAVKNIPWNGTMKSFAIDSGFPNRQRYWFLSDDKQHRLSILNMTNGLEIIVESKPESSITDNYESIYKHMNNIDDNASL